jgi:uncharacterized protein (TIGR03437 family)
MFKIVSILLALAPAASAASLIQPAIDPDGVVNAASYLRRGFSNSGIARGAIFIVIGKNLGPDTLVQAGTLPLPAFDGLSGTRVHIDAPGVSVYTPMLYTSARQVAAVMPSNIPEGTATITLNYNNLTSNPVTVRVVRSQPGLFTLNQGGNAQAIAQNWRATSQLLNTLVTPATPGQTMILWATGLGPIADDEAVAQPAAFPIPIDSLTVGGQPAKVTYSGRSACCVALDQITFEVPANVTGCYLPIAVVTGGVTSNFATIAVSADGTPCDDPLSFSSASLKAVALSGRVGLGQIDLRSQQPAAGGMGRDILSANFATYSLSDLVAALAPVNPSAGSCFVMQTGVNDDLRALSRGTALNAGVQVATNGRATLSAPQVGPGSYFADMPALSLPEGAYGMTGGGLDIGTFSTAFNVPPAVQWMNASDYASNRVVPGQPLRFVWSGGDPNGFAFIRIDSSDGSYQTSIRCNARASAGSFTIPDTVTRALVSGAGTVAFGSFGAPSRFNTTGLEAGTITAASETVVQVNVPRQ